LSPKNAGLQLRYIELGIAFGVLNPAAAPMLQRCDCVTQSQFVMLFRL